MTPEEVKHHIKTYVLVFLGFWGLGAPLTSCTFFARPKGLAQKVELGAKSFMIQAHPTGGGRGR